MTPTNDKIDQSGADERAKFEGWATSSGYAMALDAHGDYLWNPTKKAWADWQRMCGIASTQPAPRNDKPLEGWTVTTKANGDMLIESPSGDSAHVFMDDISTLGEVSRQLLQTLIFANYATPQPFPAPAVQSGELPELPTPWGYARNVDGRIQVSVGPDRPPCNERGSGYFTPWAAMYGGDQMQAYARQAIAQTAPAVAGEAADRVEVLLEVIRCVRGYPDFDEPSWLGEMMDQALAGKTPDALNTIEALSRGVAPSQGAKQ